MQLHAFSSIITRRIQATCRRPIAATIAPCKQRISVLPLIPLFYVFCFNDLDDDADNDNI